jgi:hypothetical protein
MNTALKTYLRQELVHFHNSDIFPNTNSRANTKGELRSLEFKVLFLALEPALWLEHLSIFTVESSIALDSVGMGRYLSTFRNVVSVDSLAAFWCYTREKISRRRVETQTLFNACNEEGKVLARLFILDRGREKAGFVRGINLPLRSDEGTSVRNDKTENGAKRSSSGVCAGLNQKRNVRTLLQ